jgi:CRISPR-associated protein Cmr1
MKTETFELEFITPCFSAGADQAKAELRAPSIRGQLRWWFRVLGGSTTDERTLFGGVHGEATSSNIRVRICSPPMGGETGWSSNALTIQRGGYLWYFIKAGSPTRWQPNGAIAPGSKFTIEIAHRSPLSAALQQQWATTLEAFLRFGGIGYRLTRCGGSIRCDHYAGNLENYQLAAARLLQSNGFSFQFLNDSYRTWREMIEGAETILKNQLRKEFKTKDGNSPLGLDKPQRQTSAVYLRPLKLDGNQYRLMVFEAPHGRVLAVSSRRSTPVLKATALSLAAARAAASAPRHRR